MPKLISTSLVLAISVLATAVSAQDIQFTSNAQLVSMLDEYETRLASLENNLGYGDVPAYGKDCRSAGLTGKVEATLFRYYRADGVRTNDSDNADITFSLTASPRVTLGYTAANGMGVRARWWEYSQVEVGTARNPADFFDVETYTLDLEAYHDLVLNDIFDMEISGGVRYNEFREAMQGPGALHLNEFDGIGLLGALEFRAHLYRYGTLFGRGRLAGLVGDKSVTDDNGLARLNDTVHGMYELALGYRYNRPLNSGAVFVAEVAGELQHWENFSSSFEDTNDVNDFSGPSDVGFAGATFAIGLQR